MGAPEFEIVKEEGASIQFEVDGVLVTLNANNPFYVLHGSVASKLCAAETEEENETIWVTAFHLDRSGKWDVHEPEAIKENG